MVPGAGVEPARIIHPRDFLTRYSFHCRIPTFVVWTFSLPYYAISHNLGRSRQVSTLFLDKGVSI